MLRALKRRLTVANLLAMLALFVALGGTVYAAHKISGKTLKVHSVPGNRLKNDSVTGTQINEGTLGTVPSATVAGGLSVVAHVLRNGTVDASKTRGITQSNVVKPAATTGVYCFTGLGFPFKGAEVTTDYNESSDFETAQLQVAPAPINVNCPGGTTLDVRPGHPATPADSGFFIEFYN